MFIAALVTTAKKWNQPSINRMGTENAVRIHNGILFSHKEIMAFTGRLVEQGTTLSKMSQTHKEK